MSYGLHRNQLYGWRREFGSAAVADAMAEAGTQGPHFVPVVADAGAGATAIEVEIGSAIVPSGRGSIWRFWARCCAC